MQAVSELGNLAPGWAKGLASVTGSYVFGSFLWSVLFGVLGLVLAIVACAYLYRKGMLRRQQPTWDMLAKLSYVLILVCLPLAAASIGGAYGAHRATNALLDESVKPALVSQMPQVRAYLATHLAAYRPDAIFSAQDLADAFVRDLRYQPQSRGVWERSKAYIINDLALQRGAQLLSFTMHRVMLEAIRATGANQELAQSGADLTFTVAQARTADLRKLDTTVPTLFVAAAKQGVNSYFVSIYVGIAATLLGLALLVLLEIAIYRRHLASMAMRSGAARGVV
jgi:hypothetical protein